MSRMGWVVAIVASLMACATAQRCEWGSYAGGDDAPLGPKHFTCECDGTVRAPKADESAFGLAGNSQFVTSVCEGSVRRKDVPMSADGGHATSKWRRAPARVEQTPPR